LGVVSNFLSRAKGTETQTVGLVILSQALLPFALKQEKGTGKLKVFDSEPLEDC
jgi:hypothetical protein